MHSFFFVLFFFFGFLAYKNSFGFCTATKDSDYSDKDMEEIQSLLRSAARDCVPGERNSFVAFQAKTGVEVCLLVFFVISTIRIFTIMVFSYISNTHIMHFYSIWGMEVSDSWNILLFKFDQANYA